MDGNAGHRTDTVSGVEAPAAIRSLSVQHILAPLDGSDVALRGAVVARTLGARLGASLTLVGIATRGGDRGALERHLEEAAGGAAETLVIDADDIAAAILAAAGTLTEPIVCMASHGRGRTAAVFGSVTSEVAARARAPMVVVGPHVAGDHTLAGRLIVCVDGSEASETVVPVAASWAAALNLGLSIVTVAEPMPDPVVPGAPYHRSHGPSMDAECYLARVAAPWQDRGIDVETRTIYDAVSVASGLADYLEGHPPALVAASTHARTGLARLAHGSMAANVVHAVAAPVLLVP